MSDIENAIVKLAKAGRLNHISLAFTFDNKWSASYRGVDNGDARMYDHSDPLAALLGALTGKKTPEPPPSSTKRRKAAPEPITKRVEAAPPPPIDDDEDLL